MVIKLVLTQLRHNALTYLMGYIMHVQNFVKQGLRLLASMSVDIAG